MRRNEIKADGTVYADDRLNAIRVVDAERLWDKGGSRFGRKPYICPTTYNVMSSASRPVGYTGSSYTGFLVVMTTHEHVDMLTTLDIPTDITSEDALTAWKATLPQGLNVAVRVSRDFSGTFADVKAQKERDRDARQQERVRVEALEREATRQFETAEAALERHGVACHRHYSPSYRTDGKGTAYVAVRASDLTALLNRLHALESAAEDA